MRIFVTGGNGFIGSVVVKKILENNDEAVCIVRKTSDLKRIQHLSFQKVIGDVRDRQSLSNGMQGCDAVIHLASLSNWSDICSPLMHNVVVLGSDNVLNAAKNAGNLPVVFVSSVAAINATTNPEIQNESSKCELNLDCLTYSKAKIEAEKLCILASKNGQRVIIVNPAEVYGPNDTCLNTAGNLIDFAKSSPVVVCHGGTSIVHVEDVADGILKALKKGRSGERYILGGENLSVEELANQTLDILNIKKRVVRIPNGILKVAAKIADKLGMPFPVNPKVVPYATLFWFMDNSKARNELKATFRGAKETLEPTIKWLQRTNHI